MKIHLVKKQTIEDYIEDNAGSDAPFKLFQTALKFADWNKPDDIKLTFGSADLLGQGSNRVIFNIGGNNYRMICQYKFGDKEVHLYICWIGTHAEYDKLCKKNKQYTVKI